MTSNFALSCDDYNSNHMTEKVPPAMLTLDMVLPPSYHVDTWGLLDGGQLGPAVRYGEVGCVMVFIFCT